jgi:hypothetical protein
MHGTASRQHTLLVGCRLGTVGSTHTQSKSFLKLSNIQQMKTMYSRRRTSLSSKTCVPTQCVQTECSVRMQQCVAVLCYSVELHMANESYSDYTAFRPTLRHLFICLYTGGGWMGRIEQVLPVQRTLVTQAHLHNTREHCECVCVCAPCFRSPSQAWLGSWRCTRGKRCAHNCDSDGVGARV